MSAENRPMAATPKAWLSLWAGGSVEPKPRGGERERRKRSESSQAVERALRIAAGCRSLKLSCKGGAVGERDDRTHGRLRRRVGSPPQSVAAIRGRSTVGCS